MMFGGGSGNNSRNGALALGSVNPQGRYDKAAKDLKKAEEAYATAESELIKARRNYKSVSDEWDRFYLPGQR